MSDTREKAFVSVIVATRDREVFLADLLESLSHQSFQDFEALIVNDCDKSRSKERVTDIVEAYSEKLRIKLLSNSRNIGLPLSLNRGVSNSSGVIVVFTDDDCIADKDWLLQLIKWYKYPFISGVGGKVVPIEHDALWIPKETKCINSVGQLCWDGSVISNFESGQKPTFVDCLSAANMSFRRKLIKTAGGFSYAYKGNAYRFETDLALRIKRLGFKILFNPKAVVFHRRAEKGGCRVNVYEWNYWFGRNQILFILRCLNAKPLKVFLFTLKQLGRILTHRRACPYAKPERWHLVLLMLLKGLLDGLKMGMRQRAPNQQQTFQRI